MNPREHEVDDAVATIAHVTDFEPSVTSPNFKSRRDSDIFRKISTDSSDKDYRLSAPQVQKDIEINKERLKIQVFDLSTVVGNLRVVVQSFYP